MYYKNKTQLLQNASIVERSLKRRVNRAARSIHCIIRYYYYDRLSVCPLETVVLKYCSATCVLEFDLGNGID